MSTMTIEDQIEMLKSQIASDKDELARLEKEVQERYIPQEPDRSVKMVRIEFEKDGRQRHLTLHPSPASGGNWHYQYDNGRAFMKPWETMLRGMAAAGVDVLDSVTFKRMLVVNAHDILVIKTFEARR